MTKTSYLTDILKYSANRYPDKIMLSSGNSNYTYHDCCNIVNNLAAELKKSGIEGRVAILIPNSPEFIVAVFAVLAIGAVPVLLNPRYTSRELEQILEDSNAAAIATEEKGHLRFRSVRDGEKEYSFTIHELNHPLTVPIEQTGRDPRKEALMLYTSGSTGKMKGVIHTFQSLCDNPYCLTELMGITSNDIYFIGAPFFHLFGFSPGLLTAIIKGARIVVSETIGAVGVLDVIKRNNVSVLLCNATLLKQLIQIHGKKGNNLSSLRIVMTSGSVSSPDLMSSGINKICKGLLNLYGTSETGIISQTLVDDSVEKKITTIGKPLPNVDVKIVSDSGIPLPPGNVGTIICKTYGCFKEYYNMPSLTSEVIDNEGWYHTGDLGCLDNDGYLKIVGRGKEMIIKAGFNVYPREVEIVLAEHPKINDVVVVGVPHNTYGEIIRAVIILKEGVEPLNLQEVKDFCRSKIVDYKIPNELKFVKEYPMTSTGKICKPELKGGL